MQVIDTDYLVVGSGIAGLMSALHLSKHGNVLIMTKKEQAESNTNYAQGGIACVINPEDSFEQHIQDTLNSGAGLCDEAVVREIVNCGPARIADLEKLGIKFSSSTATPGTGYDLGKEGGHSKRRVLHAGDITGRKVEEILLTRIQESSNITLHEHLMVIDLIITSTSQDPGERRCTGAYLLDRSSQKITAVRAQYVILATGGGSKVYLYTSNPDIATGDGVAIAWRAGLTVRNMEFIQFHPTCLYHREARSFLISEAVRGEGAELVDISGAPFMKKYDSRGSLAPRDIVARAIDAEMKASGHTCVYLDIRHQSQDFLVDRFPNIYETCKSFGIDMASDLVPVVPAAHYFCGGVDAKLNGETALPGLLVCGEVACTGLHGANRLASNSLLEALVCAHKLAEYVATQPTPESSAMTATPDWELGDAVASDEEIVLEHNWNEVRTCMWDYVGVVRTNKRLARALRRIHNIQEEILEYYWNYLVTADILELRNLALVAELIIVSAQQRRESRGLHYTLDYPEPDKASKPTDTILVNKLESAT